MKYHELKVTANKPSHRVGRGISAGQGKTAGRGTKGQNARAGHSHSHGFAGGQIPLMKGLPKLRGFTSHSTPAETIYTGQLESLKGDTADNASLTEAGLISSPFIRVKLILKGEIKKKVTISVQAASVQATKAVEKAGGSVKIVPQAGRTSKKPEKSNQ